MVQVEAMREQIRILEGIWGGDPDEPVNALHGHGTLEWTVLTKTDTRNGARSEGRGGVVGTVEHGGEGESRVENASGSSNAGDRGITEGEGTDSGERGTHEGMDERVGSLAEEAIGNVEEGGRGTGVDAWLISYNRRLKNELQRLRTKARLAEERCVRKGGFVGCILLCFVVPNLLEKTSPAFSMEKVQICTEKGTGLYW